MRTIECIRFRSCQPIGQTLAKQLLENFSQKARSQGLLMTVWLDRELSGDLSVHLERRDIHEANQPYSSLGLSIEQMLEHHGLVSRRLLVSAAESG
jgi:hypothetical protein